MLVFLVKPYAHLESLHDVPGKLKQAVAELCQAQA